MSSLLKHNSTHSSNFDINTEKKKIIMWKRCTSNNYLTCAKLALVHVVDKLDASDGYSLTPGISLQRHKAENIAAGYRSKENNSFSSSEDDVRIPVGDDLNEALDKYLLMKIRKYLGSLSLNVKILDKNTVEDFRSFGETIIGSPSVETGNAVSATFYSVVLFLLLTPTELIITYLNLLVHFDVDNSKLIEYPLKLLHTSPDWATSGDFQAYIGRGKKKYMHSLLIAGWMSGATLLALTMKTIALLSGKALLAALLSLMLSIISAFTKGHESSKSTTYEIITKPIVAHTHAAEIHEAHPSEHSPSYAYRRSMDLENALGAKNPRVINSREVFEVPEDIDRVIYRIRSEKAPYYVPPEIPISNSP